MSRCELCGSTRCVEPIHIKIDLDSDATIEDTIYVCWWCYMAHDNNNLLLLAVLNQRLGETQEPPELEYA
jgi:hypothetical protein